jgi:hypothetical protein
MSWPTARPMSAVTIVSWMLRRSPAKSLAISPSDGNAKLTVSGASSMSTPSTKMPVRSRTTVSCCLMRIS